MAKGFLASNGHATALTSIPLRICGAVSRELDKVMPKTKKELFAAIIRVWHRVISREILQNLVETMPRSVQAVIDAKGGSTKY